MGFMFMLAPCYVCKRPFSSNPETVPSFEGEPICEDCIRIVNAKRREKGLAEWPILPGAYEGQEVP